MARGATRTQDTHERLPSGGYEIFDHPADAGLRGWGPSLEEAFANAARALFELVADLSLVKPRQKMPLDLTSADREALLVDLLNELIALMDLRDMLLCRIEDAEISQTSEGYRFTGSAAGEKRNASRHTTRTEAKAATYSQLRVTECRTRTEQRRWVAQTIIDI